MNPVMRFLKWNPRTYWGVWLPSIAIGSVWLFGAIPTGHWRAGVLGGLVTTLIYGGIWSVKLRDRRRSAEQPQKLF